MYALVKYDFFKIIAATTYCSSSERDATSTLSAYLYRQNNKVVMRRILRDLT